MSAGVGLRIAARHHATLVVFASLTAVVAGHGPAGAQAILTPADPGAEPAAGPPEPPVPVDTPAAPAAAPAPEPSGPVTERASVAMETGGVSSGGASARGFAEDWMILPARWSTVEGGLRFMTAPGGLLAEDQATRFTDVVFLDLAGRTSVRGRVELSAAVTLLPKQPSQLDANPFQHASLGARLGFAKRMAAALQLAGGPLMPGGSGWWSAADLGAEARKSIHPTIVFQGRLGGSATYLRLEPDGPEPCWFAEVLAGGSLIFRAPHGEVAFWLGTEFHFPIAADPTSPAAEGVLFLDPQTRASVALGFVLSAIPAWDILFAIDWIDRGDVGVAGTTLPILDGGFDQTDLTITIGRRFQAKQQERQSRVVLPLQMM